MPNFVLKIILQLNIIYKGWLERPGILFICSFNHHLMNAYHVPGIFLSAGTVINVTSEKLTLLEFVFLSAFVCSDLAAELVRLGRHYCLGCFFARDLRLWLWHSPPGSVLLQLLSTFCLIESTLIIYYSE